MKHSFVKWKKPDSMVNRVWLYLCDILKKGNYTENRPVVAKDGGGAMGRGTDYKSTKEFLDRGGNNDNKLLPKHEMIHHRFYFTEC